MRSKLIAAFSVLLAIIAIVLFSALHNRKPAPVSVPVEQGKVGEIIGTSVQGRKIESFTYGTGPEHLLLVGGIHGGYEWNSVLLAYKMMDYLEQHPEIIPANITATIIPDINPDGVYKVTGKEGRFDVGDVSTSTTVLASGRFNAHQVDLNRNFDCKWQPEATWQSKPVSAGNAAFSEPEAQALKSFVSSNKLEAVVFWHSASGAVYASECKNGILPVTLNIMNVYAKAASYPAVKSFDAYPVTGDSEGWLASIGIPAITVEMKTHESVEWDRNLAGVKALFEYFK